MKGENGNHVHTSEMHKHKGEEKNWLECQRGEGNDFKHVSSEEIMDQ